MLLKALYLCATPSRFSGAVALLVAAVVWAIGSVMLAIVLTGEGSAGIGGFLIVMGMMVQPVAAVVLGLSGLVNRRWTARGLLLWATTCLLGLSWLFVAVGYGADQDLSDGFVVSTLLFAVPALIVGMIALVHVAFAFREIEAELQRLRTEWLTQALDLRGWVDADEILATTGWDLVRAEQISDAAGAMATLEGARLRLDRVAERHRERILAMVQTRGKVGLDDLGRQLQEPRDALELRIAELQASGHFHGFLDKGVLASGDLARMRALGRCPACDGELDLAGRGLVECAYCSTVVYL